MVCALEEYMNKYNWSQMILQGKYELLCSCNLYTITQHYFIVEYFTVTDTNMTSYLPIHPLKCKDTQQTVTHHQDTVASDWQPVLSHIKNTNTLTRLQQNFCQMNPKDEMQITQRGWMCECESYHPPPWYGPNQLLLWPLSCLHQGRAQVMVSVFSSSILLLFVV